MNKTPEMNALRIAPCGITVQFALAIYAIRKNASVVMLNVILNLNIAEIA